MTTPSENHQKIINKLETARAKTRDLLAIVDRKREVYPTWTIKEVLSHLAGWDEALTHSIEQMLAGNETSISAPLGANEYNERSVETRRDLSYDQVIREMEMVRDQLKSALLRVPADKLDSEIVYPWGQRGPLYALVNGFAQHEDEHAIEIRTLIDAADAAHNET